MPITNLAQKLLYVRALEKSQELKKNVNGGKTLTSFKGERNRCKNENGIISCIIVSYDLYYVLRAFRMRKQR